MKFSLIDKSKTFIAGRDIKPSGTSVMGDKTDNQIENKTTKEKGNKDLWKKIGIIISALTFLFGGGLIWKFCSPPTNPPPTEVIDSTKTSGIATDTLLTVVSGITREKTASKITTKEEVTSKKKDTETIKTENEHIKTPIHYEDRCGEGISSMFSDITGNREKMEKEAYNNAIDDIIKRIPYKVEYLEQKIRNYANQTYKIDTIKDRSYIGYRSRVKLHINDSTLYGN